MLDLLKNSRGEILNLFFKNTEREYYLREIAEHLGKEPGALQRAIKDLVEGEILKDERRANLRYFKLNKKHPLYEEIKRIVSKTIGLEFHLKDIVDSIKGIDFAFIYGSVAKNKETSNSDIDLAIISNSIDRDELVNKIRKCEDILRREINYSIYTKEEFIDKINNKNGFITNILKEPITNLKGDINNITRNDNTGKIS